jgi:uncharacterized lipoprotein YehR (DUF1307 family)
MNKDKAERIVEAIKKDFTSRRGLRQEWEQIDQEIQEEITAEWVTIARKELDKNE